MPADYNINITLEKALNNLAGKDFGFLLCNAGAEQVGVDSIKLRFLGQNYFIKNPSFETKHENGLDVNPVVRVLLLHYLAHASGVPLHNRWISFKELPGGNIYNGPFTQRAIYPFIRFFGTRPEEFRFAAEKLGGMRGQGGDMSMIIPVFPNIPINYILWLGNEEFPSSAAILFDASAAYYLPTEDYAVICGIICKELIKQLQHCKN